MNRRLSGAIAAMALASAAGDPAKTPVAAQSWPHDGLSSAGFRGATIQPDPGRSRNPDLLVVAAAGGCGTARLGQTTVATLRNAPIVTVIDGASHALAFLGAVFGQRTVPLGMDHFGQSGGRADLYGDAGIDAGHIVNAALVALAST